MLSELPKIPMPKLISIQSGWRKHYAPAGVGDHAPARGLPVKHPLMHRTRTVDYAVILSGEIDMMLDDSVVHVRAGDVIVQQATNHAWINRGTQPCRILFALIDSRQP